MVCCDITSYMVSAGRRLIDLLWGERGRLEGARGQGTASCCLDTPIPSFSLRAGDRMEVKEANMAGAFNVCNGSMVAPRRVTIVCNHSTYVILISPFPSTSKHPSI